MPSVVENTKSPSRQRLPGPKAFLKLLRAAGLEGGNDGRAKHDRRPTPCGLRLCQLRATPPQALKRVADPEACALQINVLPPQSEELAQAKTRR